MSKKLVSLFALVVLVILAFSPVGSAGAAFYNIPILMPPLRQQ